MNELHRSFFKKFSIFKGHTQMNTNNMSKKKNKNVVDTIRKSRGMQQYTVRP